MIDSIGVRIANKVSKKHNINDTIWVSDLITLADEIDDLVNKALIKGALLELSIIKDSVSLFNNGLISKYIDNPEFDYEYYIKERIIKLKELEGAKKNE